MARGDFPRLLCKVILRKRRPVKFQDQAPRWRCAGYGCVDRTIEMLRRRKTLMFQEAYDIVIVGAGAAGCVVASYLAEHTDASIALIEAGDMDRDPFIHIPAGFANMLAHDRHVWKYETVPQHGVKRAYR